MRLVLHPKVSSDVSTIMQYYEQVGTAALADEFYQELRRFMIQAAARPESFAIRERNIRRVNLRRFPYHFLFVLLTIQFAFWLCAITGEIHGWPSGVIEYTQNEKYRHTS
jgi:hypothetical protein